MTEKKQSKTGGGKLSRSETVTVRLDPKLRYLAELAARKQRRTLSSFIEWSIEDSLNRVLLKEGNGYNNDYGTSVADAALELWDVDEADRFARLALNYPDLLTHEEQILWKLVRENGFLWRGNYKGSDNKWTWIVDTHSLIFKRLRDHWNCFVAVAKGDLENTNLPTWNEQKIPVAPLSDEDDLPF